MTWPSSEVDTDAPAEGGEREPPRLDGPADLTCTGLVLDLDKFATHDGPGIRTAVYLKGCPLRCLWCHSPESRGREPELLHQTSKCAGCGLCVESCPNGAIRLVEREPEDVLPGASPSSRMVSEIDRTRCSSGEQRVRRDLCRRCVTTCYPGALRIAGEEMTVAQVVDEVEKDRVFFETSGGGVTLTGGEVALQPRFSYHFLAACRERGIHTALETSGYGAWWAFAGLARVTDLFLYDLKHVDDERHRALTGVSNRLIQANLARLAKLGAEIVVRVPCIPGLNDSAENLAATARLAMSLGLTAIHLLPYNSAAGAKYGWLSQDYGPSHLTTQSSETMESLAGICRSFGLRAQIGG